MRASGITRRRLLAGGTALAAAGLTGACGRGGTSAAGAPPAEKVTVLTGASFQGREAPLFVAKQMGWFRDAGLEVQVLAGKGTTENLKMLASGQATFATLDVSGAIIEYTNPKPDAIRNFTMTAVLHQTTLACFVALASSGISTPRDLAGKTLSYLPGGVNDLLLDTYAELADFDPSKVTWVSNPIATQHAGLLAARKVDAISQFVPAVQSVEAVAKQELAVLAFADVMGSLHGSAIGVTTETARTKPDLVRRFNGALVEALRWSLDHPEQAGQIYADQPETKSQPVELAVAEIKAMTGYVKGQAGSQIGHFNLERVAQNIAILKGAQAITNADDLMPEHIVTPSLVP